MADTPDRIVALEPYEWDSTTTWTPALVGTALTNADGGNLQSAADLCDAMMADDRVRGVLSTRVNALLGCPLIWEAERAQVRKAIDRDWLRIVSESDLGDVIRWGLMLGVGLGFKRWEKIDGRWIPRITPWSPRNLLWDWKTRGWYLYDADHKRIDIAENDPNWWIFLPYGGSRPWSKGMWRAIALYWLGKQYAWRDWQRHNQLHGSGVIAGRMPEGATTQTPGAQAFWRDLQALAGKARILLPAGYGLELLEAKSATWQTFPETKKVADTAIAIVALGQNLTTEVDGGSYAAATAHGTVRQDYLESDAELTSTSLHDGPLGHWARFNFGAPELAPWARWQVDPPEDVKAQAETQKAGGEATRLWLDLGVPVDRKAQAERFKVPVEDGAEFTDPSKPGAAAPESVNPQPARDEEPDEDGQLRAASGGVVTLASGSSPAEASGFVRGQRFVDAVAASGRDASGLSPWIDRVTGILDELEDGPDWPERLRAELAATLGDGEDLQELLERAMVMAELAGRFAVLEDL